MHRVLGWISKMAFLNILWIIFTLTGIIVFGFFPASVALLMVFRDIKSGNEKSLFKSFLHYYVQNFPAGNVYGYVLVIVNVAVISLVYLMSGEVPAFVLSAMYAILLIIFIMSLYVLPVFSYFEATFFNHMKLAAIMALANPAASFVLLTLFAGNVGIIMYTNILILFPFLFLFFMFSGSFLLAVTILLPVFKRVEESSLLKT